MAALRGCSRQRHAATHPIPTPCPGHTGCTVPRESWDSHRKATAAQVQTEGPFWVQTRRAWRVGTLGGSPGVPLKEEAARRLPHSPHRLPTGAPRGSGCG